MAKHRYTYHGTDTVHLPEQGITAQGGDSKTIHESDTAIKHPDFHVVHDEKPERKEKANSK